MSKTITLTFESKDYVLEFTKDTIRRMEAAGFAIRDAQTKPMTTLPTLFSGAFLANNRWVKQEVIDKIYANLKDKESLMFKLIEMYNEQVESLFDEPEESEKNATWEASF